MESNYKDYEKLIYATIHHFIQYNGGNFDDLLSEANMVFIKVSKSFDPNKGKFSSWLRFHIWKRCIDHQKKQMCYSQIDENYESKEKNSFDILDIMDKVQEDARLVLNLIIYPPDEIENGMKRKGPQYLRTSVKRYLSEKIGWTVPQINKTFSEIRGVI